MVVVVAMVVLVDVVALVGGGSVGGGGLGHWLQSIGLISVVCPRTPPPHPEGFFRLLRFCPEIVSLHVGLVIK